MNLQQRNVPIAIIGAGPAGIAAAIQLSRSGRQILVIASRVGGLIRNANLIENLIGFPEGISGSDYERKIIRQFESHHIPFLQETVLKINQEGTNFTIITETTEIHAETILIATGTHPKSLNIPGEAEAQVAIPKRLFYEIATVVPHFPDLEADRVLIVGSGDAAYDYALQIAKHAKKITILQRTSQSSSLSLLHERVLACPNISVREPIRLQHIEHSDADIRLLVHSGEKTEWIAGDLLLVAIGRKPNIAFLSALLHEKYSTSSPHPNLYFIGDVKNGNFRQVSIAMGDAMKAAMDIIKNIKQTEKSKK